MSDRYALIGNPLGHTKSPLIHGSFARESGQDLSYEAIEAPVDKFVDSVKAFRAEGGRGLNVTAPFKLEAFALAMQLSARARAAGAVNALKFVGGTVHGENFDGVGLVRDIVDNLGSDIKGRRVLVLGAGGAARGAMLPIITEGPARVMIANRSVPKALALGEAFSSYDQLSAGGYGDIGTVTFDIIINATSASWRGELPPVPRGAFARGALAYDVVYGKGLTPFLTLAREAGAARLAEGVGMLVEQAAESFAWWRGVRPATARMITALSVPLT